MKKIMHASLHIIILLAFVVSTMPGFTFAMATATPMQHQMILQNLVEQTDNHHDVQSTYVNVETGGAGYACCKDEQTSNTQNKNNHKKCCDGDCRCMIDSCTKTQSLYHSSGITCASANQKLMFVAKNEHYDDSITDLLRRPPKA